MAPARTPHGIISALNAEVAKVLHADDTRAQLFKEGIEAVGGSPEQFAAHIRSEQQKWAQVIKAAKIKAE